MNLYLQIYIDVQADDSHGALNPQLETTSWKSEIPIFNVFQDNPSDKDVNQGTLVVFNLDASVSNDDLRHIFGVYGEVKEVSIE